MENIELKRLGVASETIFTALEEPMNKNLMALISKLELAEPSLPTLLDIRAQIKAQRQLMRELGVKVRFANE